MSVADEIKVRLDIVNYVQQYVPLKKAGRNYKACCPFHSERTPSFVVNPDTQTWRCFGACAEGGDVFNFAMKQHGWTFPEALQELGNQVGVEVRKQTPQDRQRAEHLDGLRGLLQAAADIYHRQLVEARTDDARSALDYTREKRGFSDETIEAFGIGYAPPGWQNMLEELTQLGYDQEQIIEAGIATKSDAGRVYDRFRHRLMIPIRDERGRVIAFGARALDPNDNPKYLNSPQTPVFDKSQTLFGLDAAKKSIRDEETAVIVEGYMDVIQAHQAGFTNVVAQMGTAMTETQLKLIVPRHASKVVLALDSDAAGQNATRRSLETARQTLEADYAGRLSVDLRVLQIPAAKDPDDMIRENPDEWRSLVEHAVPVADFVIDLETATLSSESTIHEREVIVRRLLPILIVTENDRIYKDYIRKLTYKVGLDSRDVMVLEKEYRDASKNIHSSRSRQAVRHGDTSTDEPPPIDYDTVEPPDYDYPLERDHAPAVHVAEKVDVSETYCLRMLLAHSELLYHINRRLRELAGESEQLQHGPLAALGVGDFTRSDCRIMMQMFLFALKQDEMSILDFLRENLDPALRRELERLLAEDSEEIHDQINRRFPGDLPDVWKQHERRIKAALNPGADLMSKVLQLRLRRLNREIQELNFQLTEAERAASQTQTEEIRARIFMLAQARKLIDFEVQQQISHLM
jgi:DNA primase